MEVPPEILGLLVNTQSIDQTLRLQAEERIRFFQNNELQFPLLLTSIALTSSNDRILRQLALTILKGYVLHSWSLSSERYTPNPQLEFLPQEQKQHIRQAMLHLLQDEDHSIRDLAANIVPKIAQADWPHDWPGFLEQLSSVIQSSTQTIQVISVLKVLREFISETLTDESYFTVVPPITQRLLSMQAEAGLLVRAKALSVFRACMEQMEMYKDTSVYRGNVKRFVDGAMGPWVAALNGDLSIDITTLSDEDYNAAVKLTHATYKTIVLLERAFTGSLMHFIPPLLETTFSKLDQIYPHYHQSLCSDSVSSQLKRYVSDLFGILQIVLRARTFNVDNRAKDLDQHIFLQCAKFAQLSDETVHQWIEDPVSIIDESAESLDDNIVRTTALSCAEEHFQVSMAEYWLQYYESIHGDWRAEEAAFYILLPVIEPGKDLQNTPIQSQIQHILQEALQSTSPIPTPKYSFPLSYRIDVIDPVVCGSVMAAAFTLSQTDDNRRHWIPLLQKIISSDSPILKLQGLLTILRTLGPQVKSEDISGFPHHEEFQTLTLQLLESLIPLQNDVSALLIQCLSYIVRLDPQIVQTSRAMDIAFHFFLSTPEIPAVRHDLAFTLETWVFKTLWTDAFDHGRGSWGDRALEWLSKAVEMVNIASGRPKDDALVIVSLSVLNGCMVWWVGDLPEGIVRAVFPSLAGILLREDDVTVLEIGQKLLSLLILKGYDQISQWTSSDGKSGLEVLMMIIEKSLVPSIDESQRILAGPLIADLASNEIQPHLPTLLNVIITQLSTATKPEFIQSLLHVFATLLIIHPPEEILTFCSTLPVNTPTGPQSALEVLLKTWTETFEVIQGYNQIRLSVVALARVFEFGNVDGIMVRGEEITEPTNTGRIVTRSQRRKVQWTTVPCKLKILKLFIKELGNITEGEDGAGAEQNGKVVVEEGKTEGNDDGWEDSDDDGDEEGDSDDDEWEDVGSGSNELDDTTSQQDILKGINTKTFIIDFLRKVSASGQRWELSLSEVDVLKATQVI